MEKPKEVKGLKVGDRVQVVKGPFETSKGVVKKGCIGRVLKRYDDGPDHLRVEVFGPSVELVKPADHFEGY